MGRKVICYGDSNTWGYDPRSFFGDRYDMPWPELLARKTGWDVANEGENGRQIPVRPAVIPENMELLIVMLGTNDLLQGICPEQAADRMENFLKGVGLPKEKLLLVAPPRLRLGAWVNDVALIQLSRELSGRYQELSEKMGFSFADAGEWNLPLAFDGVHLTEEGHRIFAEKIYEYLKECAK